MGTFAEEREFVWKYFSLHAEQRMRMFQFFILLVSLLGGALGTLWQDPNVKGVGIAAGLALTVLAIVFWQLDRRTRQLVKHAEEAFLRLEEREAATSGQDKPVGEGIFTTEPRERGVPKGAARWLVPMSYTECFRLVFLGVGLLGIAMSVGFGLRG